ncbi:1-acylglycerol-3-phosphate O-acyltransferase [Heracleum sosnowskyi]|uniref:1-acylglycerol-3-phosphate O-acyltransferase n=1 Tax=Heracleum sosnowskyi TaxID=360622 RepID=A0AAD8NB95_9APIA|nr:1-acylglycerol-3-phosphate O-acyltransferase [Heracleum sosnowskyi]
MAPVIMALPLGLLLLISGLIVNSIQAIFFILFRPISMRVYRIINRYVTEMLWLEVIWLADWWANVKVELFMDSDSLQLMGKEHALVISNHRSDIDWLVGWILAQRSGCLGSALAVAKNSSKYLPVMGWSMYFSEYIFLERNWASDENTLKSGLRQLCHFPRPFWLALFPEGTRFTQAKLEASQEYASAAGLPIPRNVLIPRTKGFVSAVKNLRSFVPAIYNITIAVPRRDPRPTMSRIISGQSFVVHVHIKRHLMDELPVTEGGISQWCKDMFVEKDALLELHLRRDTFNGKDRQQIGRPKTSLLVVIFWYSLLTFGAVKLVQWCTFSWAVLALLAGFIVLVMLSVQILINFTRSEYSTPPLVNQANSLKASLLPK